MSHDLAVEGKDKPLIGVQVVADTESWLDKARREVDLLSTGGWNGAKLAVHDAIDHPKETAQRLVLAGGVGLGLAWMSKGSGGLLAKIIGTALTVHLVNDATGHMKAVGAALSDTWRSADNFERNQVTVEDHLGRYAADSAMMALAGGSGFALGRRFQVGEVTGPRDPAPAAARYPSHRLFDPALQASGRAGAYVLQTLDTPLANKLFTGTYLAAPLALVPEHNKK